jgi:hypothetical protein
MTMLVLHHTSRLFLGHTEWIPQLKQLAVEEEEDTPSYSSTVWLYKKEKKRLMKAYRNCKKWVDDYHTKRMKDRSEHSKAMAYYARRTNEIDPPISAAVHQAPLPDRPKIFTRESCDKYFLACLRRRHDEEPSKHEGIIRGVSVCPNYSKGCEWTTSHKIPSIISSETRWHQRYTCKYDGYVSSRQPPQPPMTSGGRQPEGPKEERRLLEVRLAKEGKKFRLNKLLARAAQKSLKEERKRTNVSKEVIVLLL